MNSALGLSSPMGPQLRQMVEDQPVTDLRHYGIGNLGLHFDWSASCIEGHLATYLDGSLENYSGIAVFDASNSLMADGWMEYVYSGDFEDASTFFLVYWDFLDTWHNGHKTVKKRSPGIPDRIWQQIPENLKAHLKNERMQRPPFSTST